MGKSPIVDSSRPPDFKKTLQVWCSFSAIFFIYGFFSFVAEHACDGDLTFLYMARSIYDSLAACARREN
jgi:hypothetical protein